MSGVTGIDTLNRNMSALPAKTKGGLRKGMRKSMSSILEEARANAPRQTGELQDSGRLVESRDGISAEFSAQHAAAVHEDPRSSGHKFMSKVLQRRQATLIDEITKAAKLG